MSRDSGRSHVGMFPASYQASVGCSFLKCGLHRLTGRISGRRSLPSKGVGGSDLARWEPRQPRRVVTEKVERTGARSFLQVTLLKGLRPLSESSWVNRVRSKAFRVVSSAVPKPFGGSAVLVCQVNGAHRETSRESGHAAVVTELRATPEALSVVPAGRQGMPEAGRFDSQGSSSR